LAPLLSFEGGDAKILACYRDLLALCMVSSYRNDAATDRQIGKYNPVDSGVWDAEALSRDLIASIEGTITPEISAFYAVDEALKGYWGS
ncbi:MAG: hypothetical protein JXM71_11725, partial [Spirochaetales bacterium]|nr:hypothetical protein [Spirochaetales bacterium]